MPKLRKKAKKPMHPVDITAGLKKAGSSQSVVAEHLNVSQTSVCAVVNGRENSHRIAKHIADILGKSVDQIWGNRYDYEPRESFKERCERAVA